MKIVLIGAGSSVFTQGLVADFITSGKDFYPLEIGLVDIDEKALDSITKLTKKMVDEKETDIQILSSTDRRELLPDADVVVTTIAVGGRRAWEDDVFIPRKYGIYQPVGDTTMPGGISRAQRMIPVMLEIARDIKELCPNAYFFNYSNPMTAICAAIQKELGMNVIGLCHGVIHVEQYLARFLGKKLSEVKSLGVGLNHLTFLYDIRVNGEDAKPLLIEKLHQQQKGDSNAKPHFSNNPFSWSFFEKYQVFPAVLDRHVVEFFPERFASGDYYGKKLGVEAISFENVIADGDRIYKEMHEMASGKRELNHHLFERSEGEHEQLVDILHSIYRDERKIFSVNMPNNGAIPNLPKHAVLELPAVASAGGFKPLYLEDYPSIAASFIRKRLTVVDLTVEAALTGDVSLFVEALLADGSVQTEAAARKLAHELLEAHRKHLPQYFS
jgi:alpha-galactosidase